MTVVRTSLRNLFAHKGRMALSAVAVLLSVAFVCGTLVFTDTMNATFDKLFSSTSADVTVSPKKEEGESGQATGRPRTLPVSLVRELGALDGAESVVGDLVADRPAGDQEHHGDERQQRDPTADWHDRRPYRRPRRSRPRPGPDRARPRATTGRCPPPAPAASPAGRVPGLRRR